MKKLVLVPLMLGSLLIGPGSPTAPRSASASFAISVSYFHDSLAPYGRWVDYSPYGWCWVPTGVPIGWRPYSDGYWAYSDYGWTWVSYEPWGWAAYHYGRWVLDPYYGWVWVPGTVWAPAWVAWRASDDWCGWAPLSPGYDYGGSWLSFSVSYAPGVEYIPADRWCFVPTRYVVVRDVDRWITPVYRNVTLIEETRNVTRYSYRGDRVVNYGMDPVTYERRTGRSVPRVQAVFADSPIRGRAQRVGSDRITFFRPQVRGGNRGVAPRPEVRMGRHQQSQIRQRLARDPVMRAARDVEKGRAWRRFAAENRGGAGARSLESRRSAFDSRQRQGRDRPGFEHRVQRERGRPDFGRRVQHERGPAADRRVQREPRRPDFEHRAQRERGRPELGSRAQSRPERRPAEFGRRREEARSYRSEGPQMNRDWMLASRGDRFDRGELPPWMRERAERRERSAPSMERSFERPRPDRGDVRESRHARGGWRSDGAERPQVDRHERNRPQREQRQEEPQSSDGQDQGGPPGQQKEHGRGHGRHSR